MDSATRLDYLLFLLTPTRTRCDLLIFSGEYNEKLAYGLLVTFLSHLRSAKDRISKGGYSITLRPPISSGDGSWFTKSTLQRFVRFVSTPEVLERFVTIEREIEHIQSSIRNYEASNGGTANGAEGNPSLTDVSSETVASSHEFKSGNSGSTDDVRNENSKFRLRRVLETRKVVLQKEQAMVFARALAAGFNMDNLGHLISFSDAFGASRLREACVTFMDLCKKKDEDRLWRDQVAAMQALPQPELAYTVTSGIILAGEDNEATQSFMTADGIPTGNLSGPTNLAPSDSSPGSSDVNPAVSVHSSVHVPSTDGKAHIPFPWANVPQYLHNFQGPVYQQMPPYQGYGYPGIPYYPGNMQWPPNASAAVDQGAYGPANNRLSYKKKERTSRREQENEDSNDGTEPTSDSSSESDSSVERRHRRKQGKNSSKKVVIRNINYITSKGDGEKTGATDADSSDDKVYLDCDTLKQQVEEAVGSFEKQHKSASLHKKRNKHLGSKDPPSTDLVTEDELLKNENDKEKKGNMNWDFLQELLMREENDSNGQEQQLAHTEEEYSTIKTSKDQNSFAFDLQAEETIKQKQISTDSVLVSTKELGNDGNVDRNSFGSFQGNEDFHLIPIRGSMPEEFLLLPRDEDTQSSSELKTSDFAPGSSLVKIQSSDDWIVFKTSDKPTYTEGTVDLGVVDGRYLSSCGDQNEDKKKIPDDSFMVQARVTDINFNSQLSTDVSIVSDILGASVNEYGSSEVQQGKLESVGFYEPDDLYMVLDRNAAVEQAIAPWTPQLDYESNKSMNEACKNHTNGDACVVPPTPILDGKGTNRKTGATDVKTVAKDARAKGFAGPPSKGKPETISGNRKPPLQSRTRAPNGLIHKEGERRQKMEELRLQRPKRIAEGSSGIGRSPAIPKRPQSKAAPVFNRVEKLNAQSSLSEETKKVTKPVFRSSTIERLAAARTAQKVTTNALKPGPPKKEASNVKAANTTRGLPKLRRAEDNKVNHEKAANSFQKTASGDVSENNPPVSDVKGEKHNEDATVGLRLTPELLSGEVVHPCDVNDSEDIKEVHVAPLITNGEPKPCYPMGDQSLKLDSEVDNIATPNLSVQLSDGTKNHDQGEFASLLPTPVLESAKGAASPALTVQNKNIRNVARSPEILEMEESTSPTPVPELAKGDAASAALFVQNKNIRNPVRSPEISEIEESTPPPTNGTSPIHSRKKWDTLENSPKASSKGIRKLLMFGRKT